MRKSKMSHLKNWLDLILEGEVERLLREVPEDAGKVSAPKTQDTLVVKRPTDAVADPGEALQQHNTLDIHSQ